MKKIFSLLLIMLLFSFTTITAYASSPNDVELFDEVEIKGNLVEFDSVMGTGIKLPKNVSARSFSYSDFSGGYLNKADSLTETDVDDYYFFSTSATKFLAFKINSTNANYVVEVGVVNWDNGMYYPTSYQTNPSTGTVWLNGVAAGDYALRVYSTDTVGDSYTVTANALCPSSVSDIYYESADLSLLVVKLNSGAIYQNNINLETQANKVLASPVELCLEDSWPVYPSGTEYYTHDIADGTIRSISAGSFYTNKRSVKNALFVKLGEETLWTYTHSIVNNGSTLSFIDVTGQKTPRRFDYFDVKSGSWGDHYLIYDIDAGRYVDFFSVFNVFFSSGGQVANSNTKIYVTLYSSEK